MTWAFVRRLYLDLFAKAHPGRCPDLVWIFSFLGGQVWSVGMVEQSVDQVPIHRRVGRSYSGIPFLATWLSTSPYEVAQGHDPLTMQTASWGSCQLSGRQAVGWKQLARAV